MKERRQYTRQSKSLEVSYRVVRQFLKSGSRTVNISEVGVRFPIFQKLEEGTILELEVRSIEIENPIVATGKVVWINKRKDTEFPFEIGLKFIKIAPSDIRALDYIFEKLKEKDATSIKWIG